MASGDKTQIADRLRMSRLLTLYGELLPGSQRAAASLHFEEDLSLAEIAESKGTSRQAVHGAVRTARKNLERYDKVLGLLAREEADETVGNEDTNDQSAEILTQDSRNEALSILDDIRKRYLRGNILYDTRGLRSRLDDLEALFSGEHVVTEEG